MIRIHLTFSGFYQKPEGPREPLYLITDTVPCRDGSRGHQIKEPDEKIQLKEL
jgi:hypothetical protein